MIGEVLTVTRGFTDNLGNRETTGTHEVRAALTSGTWSRNTGQRAESSKGGAELYAVKGVDLRPRDRVTRPTGQTFTVVAGPLWDVLHPVTGHDFGVVVYQLEAVGG